MSPSINQTFLYKLEKAFEKTSSFQPNVRNVKGKDKSVNLTNINYVPSQTFETKVKKTINANKIPYSSNIQVNL